ncbi:MerR family transcriptional regulator [Clostridium estertheticum]|uniref:Helix-turn-helix domain-containing protein n=1 Tax=Clostridium estertheticum subsp. estertheticum TaxID=1552 RepID=A0A1J0GDB1_9CLOT|nr:hypothetical protein [Clostridium estertheticum]APC39275.1 hypothetical protein A7L45_03965 [Clostridium estertheticum subsp. estertheticum]MBZ9614722.1 hypothetical protein [Clostridium estertheticum subsp. laramiense]WAG74644.1 hypothetical protein LL032_04050 [Clostridium estertheticum]
MFAIKAKEKINSSKYADTMLNSLMNTPDGIDTLKIITNYVAKTSSKKSELRTIDEKIFENSKLIKNYLKKAIDYMIEVALESEKTYSTGELAKYFGVSITAINKWVKEGRFADVERSEKNKQLRISENTLWKSNKGELIPIREIVEIYGEDIEISKNEEIIYIMEDIKFFEKKYGGIFKETLEHKENKSSVEEADAREWLYLVKKIKQ